MTMTPVDYLNKLMALEAGQHSPRRWERYWEPVPELSEGLPVPVLGIMVLIWQLRDQDLQKQFPLNSKESCAAFICWCVVHGRTEYRSLRRSSKLWDALNLPAVLPSEWLAPDDPGHALSWMMVFAAEARPDLSVDLRTRAGRIRLLGWYLVHGREEMGFGSQPLPSWQVQYLLQPSSTPGLHRLHEIIYAWRSDVRQAFPLTPSAQPYLDWFEHFIRVETRLIDALQCDTVSPASEERFSLPHQSAFGVNVIGYAFGQFGIAEDSRMAVKSLLEAKVPATLINFLPGDDMPQADRSMADHVSLDAPYAINLFCLTALEQGRHFAEEGMPGDGYNIGYWPWELSAWPQPWQHLFSLVDEIWVSSQHTYDAVIPVSPVPVRLMPMAVDVSMAVRRTRAYFGLPEQARLFLFSFDLNSSTQRKNPGACIDAFLKAFPRDQASSLEQEVGLVIKIQKPGKPNKTWRALKSLRAKDARIHFIERSLPRSDLLALYQSCDCFISLHRAEGFGRNIAEAMMLGVPVVVTGYSGSAQFCNDKNAFLVRYAPIVLADDDYPFGQGMEWAEPSVAHAAEQMRTVLHRPDRVRRQSEAGQRALRLHHGFDSVGKNYLDRLRIIYSERLLAPVNP